MQRQQILKDGTTVILRLALLAFIALSTALIACSGDDEPTPPTPTVPGASGTTAPGQTPLPQGTRFPPVDGTVDPLGFGGTEDITVKPLPDPPPAQAVLKAVRVGAHPEQGGWDRIVFEFETVLPQGKIHYEPAGSAVQCGSGMPVQVQGTAVLIVAFEPASAHTEAGQPTVAVRDIPGPGNSILQSRQICDFESHVNWAIGTRGQQRFKVTRLANPTRLVIDIKH